MHLFIQTLHSTGEKSEIHNIQTEQLKTYPDHLH